jgi:uncharacterized membrane protein (UPF0182 family)
MLRKHKNFALFFALLVLLPFLSFLIDFYADWLFYVETGFPAVFTTTLYAKIGAGLFFAALLFGFAQINLFYANRAVFPHAGTFIAFGSIRLLRSEVLRFVTSLGLLACAALALMAGQWGATQWEEVLLFTNRATVGTVDPVLGKDLGFYFFSLPFMERLKAFATFLMMVTALMTAGTYYLRGGITLTEQGVTVNVAVRRHLAILLGIFVAVLAAGFYLESFRLLFSSNGNFYGAG